MQVRLGGNEAGGGSIRPGGAKQRARLDPVFLSTGALPWLQAQGFSSEKNSLT